MSGPAEGDGVLRGVKNPQKTGEIMVGLDVHEEVTVYCRNQAVGRDLCFAVVEKRHF